MAQYWHEDKDFGRIVVTVRHNSRSFTAHWKGEVLHISMPPHAEYNDLCNALDGMRSRLLAHRKPVLQYSIGQQIRCFAHTVTIGCHDHLPTEIGYGGSGEELFVNIHSTVDITTTKSKRNIAAALERLMASRAERTLIPFATSLAEQRGLLSRIKRFEIGRGKRKLGHCTVDNVIQLSSTLMFMPRELVEYVICHELAHIIEKNHSANFHAICNKLLSGHEGDLEKELRHFTLPLYT
ncbi:MAG: M48 family metallopeptidase [Muribaculaceae bacterium]|nr:M48 family metallopeptidase [Muribaculaceae bacterium]